MSGAASPNDLWIFGYGSLIWRPDFPFIERRVGYVQGWVRRFYQGSADHRGTPSEPGRVVTLVRRPGHRCWGAAYRVDPRTNSAVLERLDYREKGGYRRIELAFFRGDKADPADGLPVVTYIAEESNPHYLGPASPAQIADQILKSRGPSGLNRDYLFKLEEALANMGAEDRHVMTLAHKVRARARIEAGAASCSAAGNG